LTDFQKIIWYKISYAQCEPSCCMWTDGRTWQSW